MAEIKLLKERIKNNGNRDFLNLKKAIEMGRENCLEEIKKAELIGRGGAGFPTGKKWEFVKNKEDVILICNADEGEPGTFKDRYIMEKNPEYLLEGILISAFILNASKVFIYIRGEYRESIAFFQNSIDNNNEIIEYLKKYIKNFKLIIVKGGGAYICGDETSLINSIEGERPASRLKPPYPVENGLFGKPTIVNNVETIANIPLIIEIGAEKYREYGVDGSRGTKLISLSGRINKPGVYEIEPGKITIREIIDELGGGIRNGKKAKFVIPGGISTAILVEKEFDTFYDRRSLLKKRTSMGSGAIIVVDETNDVLDVAIRTADFFMKETCGTCFPCKEGNRQIYHLLNLMKKGKGEENFFDIIKEVTEATTLAARCGLGQSVGNLILSCIQKGVL